MGQAYLLVRAPRRRGRGLEMAVSTLPNLSRLAALESLYRTGSFAAAAADQRISVPGLSSRLTALEKEVGAPLLRRSSTDKRKLELTWQGMKLANLYSGFEANLTSVLEDIYDDTSDGSGRASQPARLSAAY